VNGVAPPGGYAIVPGPEIIMAVKGTLWAIAAQQQRAAVEGKKRTSL